MTVENIDDRLVEEYEAIRQREQKLITELLDLLPKIDNLKGERLAQTRDALFHTDHPFLMAFVGPFSSGKSSIINALLGNSELLQVGPTPTTDRISILRWAEEPQRMYSGGEADTVFHPSPLLKRVSFVDTPGLESVFREHEETTRKFLHRSDAVMLIMLATQAMTARNVEYLQLLQEYGKKVVIVINQVDLLTSEESDAVLQYVQEQSRDKLGIKPDVWLVSAKRGMAAYIDGELDKTAWEESGLHRIEAYINGQLNDAERLRQKLQTPLQIMQNVNRAALDAVKANQAALDSYQSITENIEAQIAAQKRGQEKTIREINGEISDQFGAAAMQGSEAIGDLFRFSRAMGSVWRGTTELIGLARLFRRGETPSYVRLAFERHKVFEPVNELPAVVDKLAPHLEGQDMQDIDDLVKYTRREITALPPALSSKIIGKVEAPLRYDRANLQEVRVELEKLEDEARVVETETLEQTVRNTLLYLAFFELLLLVFGVALLSAWNVVSNEQASLPFILLTFLLGLGLLGFAMMPLRGRFVETAYSNRMLKLQARYIGVLTEAADKQVAYALQLRRDAALPLTRLIEAQTQIHADQLSQIQTAEQEMADIEKDVAKLGKKKLFGLRG